MLWLYTALGGAAGIVGLLYWVFKAYYARAAAAAVAQERQAGADANQVEATNEEINRTNSAASAGDAAGRVFDGQADPGDLKGK